MGKAVLFPNFRGIPEHVQKFENWIVWKEERRVSSKGEETWTKVPYVAGDLTRHAASNDKNTWRSFARAKAFYLGHSAELSGIGYCCEADQYLIDGDNFFRDRRDSDPRYGHEYEKYNLACNEWDWAGKQPIDFYLALLAANAWMEISPQHYGLHSLVRSGTIVPGFQEPVPGLAHSGMALYGNSRYSTVTGACLNAGDISLDAWQLLEEISLWVPQKKTSGASGRVGAAEWQAHGAAFAPGLGDEEVIRLVRLDKKGAILWAGGDPGGLSDSSPSGLDLALCQRICFYGGHDPARIDRIFRESGLMRDKWEREDYREKTIALAMEMTTETFTPKRREKKARVAAAGNTGGGGGADSPPADFPSSSEAGAAGADEQRQKRDESWMVELIRNSRHKPTNCLANAVTVLKKSPQWEGRLLYDEFARRIMQKGADNKLKNWQDTDDVWATCWMQEMGIPVALTHVREAVGAVASLNSYHPLRDWLDSLVWDQTPRVDGWLARYFGTKADEYTRSVGTWWLAGAIARAFHPAAKVDYVLILEGPQGAKKSQALRILAGRDEWFTDQITIDFGSKDASMDLDGKWILEIGEFDRVNRGSANTGAIKNFLTRVIDHYRAPYGRRPTDTPRQCVFAATVNHSDYFEDETGNRRFWPVECHAVNTTLLLEERDQLWAEAVHLFRDDKGIRWPEGEIQKTVTSEQSKREVPDPWTSDVRKWISNPLVGYSGSGQYKEPLGTMESTSDDVIVDDILVHALRLNATQRTKYAAQRVGRIMGKLGWKLKWEGPKARRERHYIRPGNWETENS